jgi:hypothetical protein
MHKFSQVFILVIVLTLGNNCFAQRSDTFHKIYIHGISHLLQRGILKKPNTHKGILRPKSLSSHCSGNSVDVSDRGYTRHPFSILVTFIRSYETVFDEETQRQRLVHKREQIDYGMKNMDQYELKQTLLDIFDKFTRDNAEVMIAIRHTGKYGFV